ncbi:hypothetical protein NE236_41515 [Actinoallomurus purpureus]|uniref:hypothetical protein n=1 Tax=Actinoallomurus purpureus TaxID=478114 RepID=UPI00209364B2|nr:hypothetical protein [Actinoallomurus purpureus]MCO6011448.1 hypothetical protein [Actinoallomurus purpureus]
MAQRKEARIFVTIWDDAIFRAHSPGAQRMYLYLLSQVDLSYCGVIPLRERRWARDARGLTVDQVLTDLEALAEPFREGFGEGSPEEGERPLLIIDDETGEVLVRSLIRNDRIWKQPNLLKSARESASVVRSTRIKAALIEELQRLPLHEVASSQINAIVHGFIEDLRRGLPAPPPNPSPKGSVNPSSNGSGTPSPKPSQGIGVQVVDKDSPYPQEPPPPGDPSASPAAAPTASAGVQAEEEGEPSGQTTDLALIAQVREIRPDWTTRSIARALHHPNVIERPTSLRGPAMLAIAHDQKSQHPGRLAHDGPWWTIRPAAERPARPQWCGACDPDTRLVGADHPRRCPNCHPLRNEAAS